MKTKIGVTTKNIAEFEDYLQNDFEQITRCYVTYNKLFAFENHIDGRFELQFDTIEEYDAWLVSFVYFLIPSDIVPQIAHYSGFAKEALFDKAFNVKVNEVETIVEGQTLMSPLFINYIPCSCTHWTEDGLMLLDAIIENWNNSNPLKQIKEPFKFESYKDLESFIENAKQI